MALYSCLILLFLVLAFSSACLAIWFRALNWIPWKWNKLAVKIMLDVKTSIQAAYVVSPTKKWINWSFFLIALQSGHVKNWRDARLLLFWSHNCSWEWNFLEKDNHSRSWKLAVELIDSFVVIAVFSEFSCLFQL